MATLRLEPGNPLDCASIVPASTASLLRSLHPSCMCFHPTKPLIAVGTSGYVAVYDLSTGVRTGRLDLKSIPVTLCFSPEGFQLLVMVQDWVLYGITLSNWSSRVLVPRRAKMDKPLESCLMTVAPGPAPRIYFCRFAKDVVRLAHTVRPVARDAKGNVRKDPKDSGLAGLSSGGWGTTLKLDTTKPIWGLACNHSDQQVYILHADGMLRGYLPSASSADGLTPLWAVRVQDVAERGVPAEGTLQVVGHPSLESGSLILQASRLGSVAILEQAKQEAPAVLLQLQVPGWAATLGMGAHLVSEAQKEGTAQRRFLLSCSGRVRYKGVRGEQDYITLSLGS
ncbi:MAG: hypothetical protein WDW36_009771 [Sanguina aurantia]